MADLAKYLEMLDSGNMNKRYEACEMLRLSDETSEAVIDALEKASRDPYSDVADAAKRALSAEIHAALRTKMGRAPVVVETVPVDPNATKRCPYCGEEILAVAIVCKHCGRELIAQPKKNPPGTAIAGIGLGLLVLGFVIFGVSGAIPGAILLLIGLTMRAFAPK